MIWLTNHRLIKITANFGMAFMLSLLLDWFKKTKLCFVFPLVSRCPLRKLHLLKHDPESVVFILMNMSRNEHKQQAQIGQPKHPPLILKLLSTHLQVLLLKVVIQQLTARLHINPAHFLLIPDLNVLNIKLSNHFINKLLVNLLGLFYRNWF